LNWIGNQRVLETWRGWRFAVVKQHRRGTAPCLVPGFRGDDLKLVEEAIVHAAPSPPFHLWVLWRALAMRDVVQSVDAALRAQDQLPCVMQALRQGPLWTACQRRFLSTVARYGTLHTPNLLCLRWPPNGGFLLGHQLQVSGSEFRARSTAAHCT
jgi:hypothetical protein